MRKLVVNTFMSLDGVMQSPGGPEEDPTGFAHGGWVFPYFDDSLDEPMGRLLGNLKDLSATQLANRIDRFGLTGLAAKALIPGMGTMLSKYGLKTAGEKWNVLAIISLVSAFFVTMNVLLWRSEFGARGGLGGHGNASYVSSQDAVYGVDSDGRGSEIGSVDFYVFNP